MEETTPNPQEATGQQVAPQSAVPEALATPSVAPVETPPVQLQPTQTLTPVTEEQPPVVPPQAPSRGKKSILFIALGLLLLALLAAGGYLFVNKGFLTKEKACTQEAKVCPDGTSVGRTGPNCEFAACPTPTEAPDPTANWKVYTNSEPGFTFKYPLDWDTLELGQNKETLMVAPKIQVDTFRDKPGGFGGGSFLTFTINKHTQNPAIKTDEFQEVSQENVLLGNEPAIKYNVLIIQDEPGFSKGSKVVSIVVKHEGVFLKFDLLDQQYSDTFNQILSTFKFIEAAPSVTPTSSPSASPTL